jgi:hypothetical protein
VGNTGAFNFSAPLKAEMLQKTFQLEAFYSSSAPIKFFHLERFIIKDSIPKKISTAKTNSSLENIDCFGSKIKIF